MDKNKIISNNLEDVVHNLTQNDIPTKPIPTSLTHSYDGASEEKRIIKEEKGKA